MTVIKQYVSGDVDDPASWSAILAGTSMPAASDAEAKAGLSNAVAMTPLRASVIAEKYDVRRAGAAVDGATDDSAALNAAVVTVNAAGKGTMFIPEGVCRAANVRLLDGVGVAGAGGGHEYGFTGVGAGSVVSVPAGAATTTVGELTITAGGSGYASAPTVTFTGGGGTGAAATAYVAGGAVVYLEITAPGVGYTSNPTVGFTGGGGGTGATATAIRTTPIFYTSGTPGDAGRVFGLRISGLTLEGVLGQACQGVVIHSSYLAAIDSCEFYSFEYQAVLTQSGQSLRMMNSVLFGGQRSGGTFGGRIGALQVKSTDNQLVNLEVGAGTSGDATDLWNAAVILDGGADQVTNVIAEGADVGFLIRGAYTQITNCRADINYGHGFWVTRANTGASPPLRNTFVNCWSHRNGQHATNTYDAFRVESGHFIEGVTFVGCRSSKFDGDGWAHKNGLNDGGTSTVKSANTDHGAGTASGW
jgi:hypothetical protein